MEEQKPAKDPRLVWGEIVSRCWQDEEFKKSLLADPNGVLKEAGIEPPSGSEFQIIEQSPSELYVVLPVEKAAEIFRAVMDGMYQVGDETGTVVPEGCELRVIQNTAKIKYLVLPSSPDMELTDEQLEQIVGGSWKSFWRRVGEGLKIINKKVKAKLSKLGVPDWAAAQTAIVVDHIGVACTVEDAVVHVGAAAEVCVVGILVIVG